MPLRSTQIASLTLLALVPAAALADDGLLDPRFSSDGRQTVGFSHPPDDTDYAFAVVAQPDGALLLAGESCGGNDCRAAVARLQPGGLLDTSFDDDGRVSFYFADDDRQSSAAKLLLRPAADGGGIVVVGEHFDEDEALVGLAQLTSGGDFDPAFGGGSLTPGRIAVDLPGGQLLGVTSAALTSSGRILVGGYGRQTGKTDVDGLVARFTVEGELDGAFSGDGVAWIAIDLGGEDGSRIDAIVVQPDGKIVALGPVDRAGEEVDIDTAIVRLLSGGSLDPAFDGNGNGNGVVIFELTDLLGLARDRPETLVLQPDGRILFGGWTIDVEDVEGFGFFGRLLPDGSTDPTLAAELVPIENTPTLLERQSDGKILFASLGSDGCNVRRYLAGGDDLDPTFGGDGIVTVAGTAGVQVICFASTLAGGRLVLAGVADTGDYDFFVARLQSELIFTDGFESDSTAEWLE